MKVNSIFPLLFYVSIVLKSGFSIFCGTFCMERCVQIMFDLEIIHSMAFPAALEVLRAMKSQGVPFNKDTLTLACATCYKLV